MAADMSNHAPARLNDFGERIDGARKHRASTAASTSTRSVTPRSRPKAATADLYQARRYTGERTWTLVRPARGQWARLAAGFDTPADARAYRDAHRVELDAEWRRLRDEATPVERYPINRERIGPPVEWDGDPAELLTRFGLRGVQFGEWVPDAERHAHVRAAVVALTDLSDALHVAPARLGLDGALGLAFGARGNGGTIAGGARIAATYNRTHRAINLTRTAGAGSLAHEWTHALDHALSGGDDLASDATGLWCWWPPAEHKSRTRALGLLDALPRALGALALAVLDSPVYARSRAADRYRSARYYSTLPELLARAVERAVVAALADDGGRRNDDLANVHESSPVHATIDEARPLVPLVRAVVAEHLS